MRFRPHSTRRCSSHVKPLLFIVALAFFLLQGVDTAGDRRLPPRRLLSAEDGVLRQGTIRRTQPGEAPNPLKGGTLITFVHIPKAAGDSFMIDSPRFMPRAVYLRGNGETGLKVHPSGQRLTAILLRDPVKLAVSQFVMCKYSQWGQRVTGEAAFPRGSMSNVTDGLAEWVQHFLGGRRGLVHPPGGASGPQWMLFPHLDRLGCYDPWNPQARALDPALFTEVRSLKREASQRPSLGAAMAGLAQVSFLGITDLYRASVCLFRFWTTGALPARECACGAAPGALNLTHEAHGVPEYSLDSVPSRVLEAAARLVEVDLRLFVHALARFRLDADVAEATTGVRLLCGDELRKLEVEALHWLERIGADPRPSASGGAVRAPAGNKHPRANQHRFQRRWQSILPVTQL